MTSETRASFRCAGRRRWRLSKICLAASPGISGYERALPEISRGHERETIRRCVKTQGGRFPVRVDGWDFPGKIRGQPLRRSKTSKHPWQGARPPVIFLVTVSSRARTCRSGVATNGWTAWSFASFRSSRLSREQRRCAWILDRRIGICTSYVLNSRCLWLHFFFSFKYFLKKFQRHLSTVCRLKLHQSESLETHVSKTWRLCEINIVWIL